MSVKIRPLIDDITVCPVTPHTEAAIEALDAFLNGNGFFDVAIEHYPVEELYFAAYYRGQMVGLRKVLCDLEQIYFDSHLVGRFDAHIDRSVPSYYLQAIGVLAPYRNHGIGTVLLNATLEALPANSRVFTSLMDSNTLINHYTTDHGFIRIGQNPTRTFYMRPAHTEVSV